LISAAVVAAFSLALAVSALGDHGGDNNSQGGDNTGMRGHSRPMLESSLAPSLPSDDHFHGVAPGNAPWVLRRGDVELKHNRLELRVRGLVIPSPPGDNTPGPVTTIDASLYCGADTNTTAADTTQQVPISRSGNARIRDRSFNVPDTCLAPVILVHPNGLANLYIAVDGFRG
jgi:hypothetical protein